MRVITLISLAVGFVLLSFPAKAVNMTGFMQGVRESQERRRQEMKDCLAYPQICSNRMLCDLAVIHSQPPKWAGGRYSVEAKRRALSCGIKKSEQLKSNYLRDGFNQLSVTQRKIIQKRLAARNLYKYSIDGKYGPGTQGALLTFNKKFMRNLNLSKKSSVSRLLGKILSLND